MKLMRPVMISDMGNTRVPAFDGKRLQQARLAKGWSRGRLAAAVDKTVVSVSGWERNARTPEPATLVALALAVDLDPGELLDTPRLEWGMSEFRVTKGLQQREVAEAIGHEPGAVLAHRGRLRTPGRGRIRRSGPAVRHHRTGDHRRLGTNPGSAHLRRSIRHEGSHTFRYRPVESRVEPRGSGALEAYKAPPTVPLDPT